MRHRFVLRLSSFIANPILLGVVAAVPLLANGGFLLTRGGGDSPFLLLRLHQLLRALGAGQFPARWMPDAALGFGYPFFSYYASFPYYLAAALQAYGFSFVAALKLTQIAALAVGAAGMHAWARQLPSGGAAKGLGRAGAWLAAAAYTFAPFHLANLYVRGDSLSELWAMAWFPWVLRAAQACAARPGWGRALALAGTMGLLIFTHNISALNFMPFVILYVLLLVLPLPASSHREERGAHSDSVAAGFIPAGPAPDGGGTDEPAARHFRTRQRWPWRLAVAGAALAWGLALAAFFWLPALAEIGAVQPADLTAGYFFYGNHFRGADLIQPTLFYNADTGPGLPTPFAMGLAQTALAALGLCALFVRAWRARGWTRGDTFLLAGLALSTYMLTPASAWAWERLPLLAFTQFPWRFLSIQALFTAAATGHLVPLGGEGEAFAHESAAGQTRWRRMLRPSGVAAVLGAALALFGLGGLRPEFIPLADADVTVERLQVMEYFTGNLGSTIGYEYLPRGVSPRPFTSDELLGRPATLKVLAGVAEGARLWQRGEAEGWTITATAGPARVAVPIYFWPGWRVNVDGQAVDASAVDGLGWISFEVSAGTHTVELRLARTPMRAAGEIVSLVSLLAAIGIGLWKRTHRRERGERGDKVEESRKESMDRAATTDRRIGAATTGGSAAARRYRWAVALGVLLVAGAVALRAWPEARLDNRPVSMDFAQLAYPHRDEVRFAGGARMAAITYSHTRLQRGDTLHLESAWAGAGGAVVTLGLVPGSNLISQVPVTLRAAAATVSAAPADGGEVWVSHEITIPTDIPPGAYFITVQMTGADGAPQAAVTREGRARGLVHLGPIWLDDAGAASSAAALAAFGPGMALAAASADGAVAGVVDIHLAWAAVQVLGANYNVGLRLRDAAGFEWAGSDSQLAYGFYPTFMWQAGEVVPDFYRLKTLPGTPPGVYLIDVYVYDPVSGASLGETYRFPAVVTAHTPREDRAAQTMLTPELGLGAVTLPEHFNQGEAPEVKAEWLTSGRPAANYRAQWTLIGPSGERMSQIQELAAGARTSQWLDEAFILGRARLGTESTLPPGRYTVTLALVDEAGALASAEVSVGEVEVLGRARSYTVPPLEHPVAATFGETLTLHGYNLDRTDAALRLDLVWGALRAPGRDYKFFVHLYNEADGFVAQQVDSVPLNFTYPTVLWTAGEVVTDTVTFDLAALPPGSYGIAAGWYDPNTPDLARLAARDAAGARLDGDRVLLERVGIP